MIIKKNKGFTLVEVGVASIIMLITVSGVVSTFVASIKTTRIQMATNQAQNIVQKIINEQVRNVPFSSKTTPSTTLCGSPDSSSDIAYQLRTNNITNSNTWNKYFNIAGTNSLVYSDDLKKISPSAQGIIQIRPLRLGGTETSPIYSTSKVNVKVIVKWKFNEGSNIYSEIVQSTVATDNGVFINDTPRL